MIFRSRLRAAAGPNPDLEEDGCEPDAELIPIPDVPKVRALLVFFLVLVLSLSKFRDPLHVILEYIAEVRAVCTRLTFSLYVWYLCELCRSDLTAIQSSFMMMT